MFVVSWIVTYARDSLYQHYPGFEEMIREALRGLLVEDIEKQIEMGLAKDGSGVGGTRGLPLFRNLTPLTFSYSSAALGALQATKYNKS
jgi:Hexokinase